MSAKELVVLAKQKYLSLLEQQQRQQQQPDTVSTETQTDYIDDTANVREPVDIMRVVRPTVGKVPGHRDQRGKKQTIKKAKRTIVKWISY